MELGLYLLRRAGYDETFVSEVARVMEYTGAHELYRDDIKTAQDPTYAGDEPATVATSANQAAP